MSDTLYLVRYPFKSALGYYAVGTILTQEELEEVRLWPLKLKEGKVTLVPTGEQLEKEAEYLSVRLGVDLKQILEDRASKGSEIAEPGSPDVNEPPTTGTPEVTAPEVVTPEVVTQVAAQAPLKPVVTAVATKPVTAAVKPATTAPKSITGK